MNEKNLNDYYNKFNEDKRLKTRHGRVEFIVTMKYIEEILKSYKEPKILDLGAGCGAYSIPLSEYYDVTALELVKHNLKVIEKNSQNIKLIHGNATNLSMLEDNSFDVILIFGPMYHLISSEEKLKCLNEAKRVLKKNGTILISYIMNDYAIIRHGFKDKHILEEINKIDDSFHIISKEDDLYSYVRLDDIDKLNKLANLRRIKIISQDSVSNYMREYINKLNDDEFELFIKFQLSICERYEMLGLSTHVLDILKED